MPELTDKQRADRAFHAKRALEDFLDPAFEVVTAEYDARLKAICAKEPWATDRIAAMANASRIVAEVRNQIAAFVEDGKDADRNSKRAKHIEQMTPTRGYLAKIAPLF